MRVIRPVLLAAACVVLGNAAASAAAVSVPMDEVTMVAFKQPVATVYLGNSSIAQLTLVDSRHVFVLGKAFGTTNLIALSDHNEVIANEAVTVSGRRTGMVTLNRGADTYNYSCTDTHCETHPVPGDAKAFFENTQSAAGAHEDTANKAAGPGMQSQH
jgi:hypothetical protein